MYVLLTQVERGTQLNAEDWPAYVLRVHCVRLDTTVVYYTIVNIRARQINEEDQMDEAQASTKIWFESQRPL